jgi:2,3-bisphosphoglycerate-independent phosphoglycerate mutase
MIISQWNRNSYYKCRSSIEESYEVNVTDEFIPPVMVDENNIPLAQIEEDDVVIFFNFRTEDEN